MPTGSTVTAWIQSVPPEVRPVVRALRAVVRANLLGVAEFVHHGALCYAPVERPKVFFTFIATHAGYARLGFTHGAALDDPGGLLEGTGARMRHVKVRSVAEARRSEIAALISAVGR